MAMESAHPLASELAEGQPTGRILLVGVGNGRNLLPFIGRDHELYMIDQVEPRLISIASRKLVPGAQFVHANYDVMPWSAAHFAGALSTSVLQHGTRAAVRLIVTELARVLAPGAQLMAALASQRDIRFGQGTRLAVDCFAQTVGDEIGVPHLFVNEAQLHELFEPAFRLTKYVEHDVANIVGRWAHTDAAGHRHWFIHAQRR